MPPKTYRVETDKGTFDVEVDEPTPSFWDQHPNIRAVSRSVLNALPGVGGIAGAVLSAPETLGTGSIAGGALGVGAGQGLRDLIAEGTGIDKPTSPTSKALKIGATAGTEAAMEGLVIPGATRVLTHPIQSAADLLEMSIHPQMTGQAMVDSLRGAHVAPEPVLTRPGWQTWPEWSGVGKAPVAPPPIPVNQPLYQFREDIQKELEKQLASRMPTAATPEGLGSLDKSIASDARVSGQNRAINQRLQDTATGAEQRADADWYRQQQADAQRKSADATVPSLRDAIASALQEVRATPTNPTPGPRGVSLPPEPTVTAGGRPSITGPAYDDLAASSERAVPIDNRPAPPPLRLNKNPKLQDSLLSALQDVRGETEQAGRSTRAPTQELTPTGRPGITGPAYDELTQGAATAKPYVAPEAQPKPLKVISDADLIAAELERLRSRSGGAPQGIRIMPTKPAPVASHVVADDMAAEVAKRTPGVSPENVGMLRDAFGTKDAARLANMSPDEIQATAPRMKPASLPSYVRDSIISATADMSPEELLKYAQKQPNNPLVQSLIQSILAKKGL